jgi:hypothetical protein
MKLQAKYKQINKKIFFKKTNKQTTILVLKCNSYIINRNIQENKQSSSLCIIKTVKTINCNYNNNGSGTAYPSEASEFTPVFVGFVLFILHAILCRRRHVLYTTISA